MRNITVITLALVTAAVAAAETGYDDRRDRPPTGGLYEVTSVKGEVRVWRRFAANWTAVRAGDHLASGVLVQMPTGATLKVRGVVSGPGEEVPRGFMIRAEDPLLTRVEEGSLRRMELGGYFVPLDGVGRAAPPTAAPSMVRAAWERMVAIFDEQQSTEEAQAQLAARLGAPAKSGAADDARQLKIDHPRAGDTYIVETLPTEVAVSWSDLPPGVRSLKVFFWKAEHGAPVPVGQTDQGYFRLRVPSGGRYYVRVESPDGQWRSNPHLFIVMAADQIAPPASAAPVP